jgi:hypothetical protein
MPLHPQAEAMIRTFARGPAFASTTPKDEGPSR